MNNLKQLHWPLIIGLGALAFLHPLLNISGMMEIIGRPLGPILVNLFISAVWLVTVLFVRARQPILTLVCTGAVHGLFALLLGAILSPLLTGASFAPIANPFILPFALTSVLLTNMLWGFAVGVVAWALQQAGGVASGLGEKAL
jgi:hypothetical protein